MSDAEANEQSNGNANASTSTPTLPSPSPSPVPCLAALGPMPLVNSSLALHQLAAQLHVLTTPLPTMHAQVNMSTLEDTVHAQLQRMDEFSDLLDTIKFETNQASTQILPIIQEKQAPLTLLFQQVRNFDKYTTDLERYVQYMESRTNEVDTILKRTSVMEKEYAQNKETIASSRNGVTAEIDLMEKAASKLWSSLKNLGSKAPAPTTSAPLSTAALATGAPTTLDLIDIFVPFEPCPQINDFFVQSTPAVGAASPSG